MKTPRAAFNWLGRQLQHFGVRARPVRIGGELVKAYLLSDFAESLQ